MSLEIQTRTSGSQLDLRERACEVSVGSAEAQSAGTLQLPPTSTPPLALLLSLPTRLPTASQSRFQEGLEPALQMVPLHPWMC